MESKYKKVKRVLEMYDRLSRNEVLNKESLANNYNVDNKSIQRDISDLRCYFADNIIRHGECEIIYDKFKKGYILKRKDEDLNMKSVLVLIKILLESRALCKEEMICLSDRLMSTVSPNQKKHITEIIGNEKINYVELNHKKSLIDSVWDLSESIRSKNIVNIKYKRTDGVIVEKDVKPVSIMFSEYYFYLLAYYKNYSNATIYRIDRIIEYMKVNKKFELDNNKRVNDGELRKKTQFMFGGSIQTVFFEYYGNSIEAVMDRLPTAEIIKKDGDKVVIKAEVLGNGIKMWILSQGKNIKVLGPKEFLDTIKEEVKKVNELYACD